MDFAALDRLGERQLGLLTTRQFLAAGASRGWIQRQLATGRLVRERKGVLRPFGLPPTQDRAWMAAVLSAQEDVVLSHQTAAAAWQFKGFEVPHGIDLLTLGTPPRGPGIRGHQTLYLPPANRTVLRWMPVTSAERTMIDAASGINPWDLGRRVDEALRRKLITLPRLVRCFEAVPVSGQRPSRAMKDVLAERVPGFNPGGSASELDVLAILRRAGISPLPVQQFKVKVEGRTYELDYAWPDTLHAIEYQGDPHFTVSALHDDLERWRRLQRNGWRMWLTTDHTTESEYAAIGVAATRQDAA